VRTPPSQRSETVSLGRPYASHNMTAQPVRVSYVTLLENSEEVQSHLKRAFGSEEGCLGIVVVQGTCTASDGGGVHDHRNVPLTSHFGAADLPEAFQALRIRLFYLAHALANQPEAVRESLSRPETKYSFGWSHGKEVMNGVRTVCIPHQFHRFQCNSNRLR
jgi:hypothetical protein